MRVAVLGPGGVGGLLANLLHSGGESVVVVARESTSKVVRERGIRLTSVRFGEAVARPEVCEELAEPVDALIVATKAGGLEQALERVGAQPGLVVGLLNGLDHVEMLRRRFDPETVAAGSIRVEADRPEPGVVVHTSKFLLVEMAGPEGLRRRIGQLAAALEQAGVPTRVRDSEPEVMWGKLVRLNPLALTTSAYDRQLGVIRSTPELKADLVGAIEETCAVARACGASIDPETPMAELERAHATLGSSMRRDIAAGRTPELDAIAGAVLRAARVHGLECPTIARLAGEVARRAGIPMPEIDAGA